MADVFANTTPGQAVVLYQGYSLPGAINLRTGSLSTKVIITNFEADQPANVQIQPSLLNAIYVYAFGNRIGQFTISGIAFAETCLDSNSSGVEEVLQYYATYGVATNNKTVEVRVGATPLVGFLLGVTVSAADPVFRMFRWSLKLASIPKTTQAAGTTTSSTSSSTSSDSTSSASTQGSGGGQQGKPSGTGSGSGSSGGSYQYTGDDTPATGGDPSGSSGSAGVVGPTS